MTAERDRAWVDSMPAAYERFLVPTVFEPFARDLATRAAERSPRTILELAAGTGVLTRALLQALPAAEVMATDLNDAMIGVGSTAAPGAVWRTADATSLPFANAQFDLVVCQFGVMFFPDKPAAFAEARRVLAPGGAFLFNVWDRIETHAFQDALMAAVVEAFPDDPPSFMIAVPHGYADPPTIEADVRAGGFNTVTIETISLEGEAASARDVAIGYCTGTPLRAGLEEHGDIDAAVAVLIGTMEARFGPGPVRGAMGAHVVVATT